MNDLIDTTEMYLRTIFELEEEGIVPLRARIAERLHQSGPTVSQTVARMERDGLLTVEGDRHLQLSDEGRELATAVMRKHRLAECLLVDVIGLDYADVHEEACRWEHVMSEAVERKLLTLLGNPSVSPFGNPIPGLEALRGERAAGRGDLGGARLADAAVHDGDRGGPAGGHPADQRAAAGEHRPAAPAGRPGRAAGRHHGRPAGRGLGRARRPGAAGRAWRSTCSSAPSTRSSPRSRPPRCSEPARADGRRHRRQDRASADARPRRPDVFVADLRPRPGGRLLQALRLAGAALAELLLQLIPRPVGARRGRHPPGRRHGGAARAGGRAAAGGRLLAGSGTRLERLDPDTFLEAWSGGRSRVLSGRATGRPAGAH